MDIFNIKFLTFVWAVPLIITSPAWSNIIVQEKLPTHLRWNLYGEKNDLSFEKKGNTLAIKTLNKTLFSSIEEQLKNIAVDHKYIVKLEVENTGPTGQLVITLASPAVELFNFYREVEKRHILDFWIDESQEKKSLSVAPPAVPKKVAPVKVISKIVPKREISSQKSSENNPEITANDGVKISANNGYRDFRYGAAFIWNYPPLAPRLEREINLDSKTAEYFYPVVDRDYEKNDKEAHLQLTINLFRKKKWGLMYKSMKLFADKYGENEEADLQEYLKANAILRSNMEKKDPSSIKMAINIYRTIMERTKDTEMKKGISKYLVNYMLVNSQFVDSLQLGKKLYVTMIDTHEIEEAQKSVEIMLYSLARLGQLEQINELLIDPTIKKLISPQMIYAYQFYVLLSKDMEDEVITSYEKIINGLARPVMESIVYNVAESYFRKAKYQEAIKLFDEFLLNSGYHTYASSARLRLALAYEILDNPPDQVTDLYQTAINRSTDEKISFEAKIRYVAFNSVRKIKLENSDVESRIFLQNPYENRPEKIDPNLIKLLWLVRLRTYIVDGNYQKALSYLNAIPLKTLNPVYGRVFEADGAEIVKGMITRNYQQGEYSRSVQIWESYKNRYLDKVALDPYLNFIMCHSYLKLGVYDLFDKQFLVFSKLQEIPSKTFPNWITMEKGEVTNQQFLAELMIMKNINLKNWVKSEDLLKEFAKQFPDNIQRYFHQGTIAYHLEKYQEAAESFELFISKRLEKENMEINSLADMFRFYTDSLYLMKNNEKFLQVTEVILKNYQQKSSNEYFTSVFDRIAYLRIETLYRKNTPESTLLLEQEIEKYRTSYPNSNYMQRIEYVYGKILIANKKENEGLKILENLVSRSEVEKEIKELAVSEISLMKIKNKTI